MEETEAPVTKSSGNVFADLGFDNPEEELAKADLTIAVAHAIEAKGLTQKKVAELIGLDQPTVSKLLRRRATGFSIDRLLHILNLLGQDVEIGIRPKPEGREARVSVTAAQAF